MIYLPPYSPELNPIERLWKYMKTHFIHNRVFDSLKQMMAHMVDVFGDLTNETVSSLCHCSYLDL
ncbi:MAG: transposase [Candidatus Cloacimonadaceae bacterium]|nr:transposase [Candidatus Cloacimonadaceae bacterium]